MLLVEGHKSRAPRRDEGEERGEQKRVDPEGTTEEQLQSSPSFSRLSHRSDGKEREMEKSEWRLSFSLSLLERATESQLQPINL